MMKSMVNALDNPEIDVLPLPSALSNHKPRDGSRLLKEERQIESQAASLREQVGSKSVLNKGAKKVFVFS